MERVKRAAADDSRTATSWVEKVVRDALDAAETKAAIEEAAKADGRTVSNWVQQAIRAALERSKPS